MAKRPGPGSSHFRAKKSPCRVTPLTRVSEFPDDFYIDGNTLFCKFCQHSLDWTRHDTLVDHLKCEKHRKAHEKACSSSSWQVTLETMMSSREQRSDFVEEVVRMLVRANIPLEKVEYLRPFLRTYCKQGGTVPGPDQLRREYLPRVFQKHLAALKSKLVGEKVIIIIDETTDSREKSVLNILLGFKDRSTFLADVQYLQNVNHASVAQKVLMALTELGIDFNDVLAVVTDSAAYMLKCHRVALSPVLPNSVHITCWAHVINLVGDTWVHISELKLVNTLVSLVKKAFKFAGGRKRRYLDFLQQNAVLHPSLPPQPNLTRWTSWFEAVKYHAYHLEFYKGFFTLEEESSECLKKLSEMMLDESLFQRLHIETTFVAEHSYRFTTLIKHLQEKKEPTSHNLYNYVENLNVYLAEGITSDNVVAEVKSLFGQYKLDEVEADEFIYRFNIAFNVAQQKLQKHLNNSPSIPFFKAVRIIDPRQMPSLPKDISRFSAIHGLNSPSPRLLSEWAIYRNIKQHELPDPFVLQEFWEGTKIRLPLLAEIALSVLQVPASSAEAERSFTDYGNILTDKRHNLSDENMKMLSMLYHNKDLL